MKNKNTLYIDPIEIADKYNIKIAILKNDNRNLTGIIKKEINEITIFYKKFNNCIKERFIITHLLSHYILDHLEEENLIIDTNNNYKIYNNLNKKEFAANELALKILIPKDKIEFLINKKKIFSIKELSRIMKVSETGMVHRLKQLSIIK